MTKEDVMKGIIGHNQPCKCYRCTQFHKIYDAALREEQKKNENRIELLKKRLSTSNLSSEDIVEVYEEIDFCLLEKVGAE